MVDTFQHIRRLRNSVSEWNTWRENSTEQPNLTGADLMDANLSGANLDGLNLAGASLNDADLSNANLCRANLNGAFLSEVNFKGANLNGANLCNTSLGGANLRHADLCGAILTGAYLIRAVLDGVNLSGADLNGADLHRAYLCDANLDLADLSGADLSLANLKNASARKTKFTGADLTGAQLNGADLTNAILRDANLDGAALAAANLTGAILDGANFHRAAIVSAILGNLDLSEVKGLESVEHFGPSTIGIDTIYRSGGNIPEAFLRGAGVDERFITYMGSLAGKAIEFSSCFISYSTQDQEFAGRLHADLQDRGVRCWFALHDMQGGKKLHEQIDQAIHIHDRLLLLLSPSSMSSEWVKTEIAKARKRELQEGRRMLFPIRLIDFELLRDWECFDSDTGKDSAREIREYYVRDFSNWKDHDTYEHELARLIHDLQDDNRHSS